MTSRPGWPTDPEMLAFIAETEKHYPEGSNRSSVQEARAAYNALCKAFDLPYPEDVTAKNGTVQASNPDRKIPVRTYQDNGLHEAVQTSDQKLKDLFGVADEPTRTCLMYLHGGGWIVGGLESHDSICAELCINVDIDVVAVDYRLCPEHKHPAALDDAEAVYRELTKSYTHIIVGGDSAGGHLTAALCLRLRDSDTIAQPAAQLLIYPALGASPEGGSYEENATSPGLTTEDTLHYWSVLAGDADWRTTQNPELAPLRAASFENLPPAIITSAGCDPLRDDAAQFATALTQAGVPVQWRNDPQLIHGHLRARHMSHTAMTCFMWTCIALAEIRDEESLAELTNGNDLAAFDWD